MTPALADAGRSGRERIRAMGGAASWDDGVRTMRVTSWALAVMLTLNSSPAQIQ